MAVITLTNENFDDIISSAPTVLVDFWAVWCGPCRMLSPIIDEIAEELDTITIGKVNVDEEEDLARRFGIMSIPTLLVFKNGEQTEKSIGVKPKDDIIAML